MASSPKLFVFANRDRHSRLAPHVRVAGTSKERRSGLLGVTSIENEGLWIIPCEGIHTFGMRIAIDSVFLDRGLRVKKLVRSLKPGRIAMCLTAHSVLELPVGSIARSATAVGDQLETLAFSE